MISFHVPLRSARYVYPTTRGIHRAETPVKPCVIRASVSQDLLYNSITRFPHLFALYTGRMRSNSWMFPANFQLY